ncbi:hypothetical protein [Weizmannia acidilactici]|uniref:hypothetical protein n=1 Tax=Weizmannia acidilactici TaxID=2607726 RepID=UPI00124D48B2|nr:hypothetical protein [Weizmannia acidilactici]GER74361.1 hypothetical protein BpPP18_24280 [Weizmannia acidilactici]
MPKRTKKNDAAQKNKEGFDSAKTDDEFSRELQKLDDGAGSAAANQIHKEKAKKEKSSKNQGQWKGMH